MKHFYFITIFFTSFLILFLFPFLANQFIYASNWVTIADFNSTQVQPNQNISTTITVNTWIDNSEPNDTANWHSTQYLFSNQPPVCVDTPNHDITGFYTETFNILSPLTVGIYDITLKAFADENCSQTSINNVLTLFSAITVTDTTPPETFISNKPDIITQNKNAEFTFTSNETAIFECQLDDQNFSSCSSPHLYSTLTSGRHTFFVRAIDTFQNIDPTPATYAWVIDNTSPNISVNSQITNNKTPKITGSIDDNTATISVQINSDVYNAINNNDGTWEVIISNPLSDGTYNVVAKAIDLANNSQTDITDNELFIDSIAPTATYKHYINGVEFTGNIAYVNNLNKLSFTSNYTDSNPSSQLLQDSYVIFQAQNNGSFNFSQNGKKSYCSWRNEPNLVHLSNTNYSLTTPEPFTKCISDLPEGEYYMSHQIYDRAVRKDIPSITQFRDILGLHFIIDKTPPIITINSYNTNPTNQNITVTATSNEGVLNSSSYVFTQNGSFDFIATDAAGNTTTRTIVVSNIDKEAPTKPQILTCNSFTNQKYVTIDWNDSTDNIAIAGYDYLIDYPKNDGVNRGLWQTHFTQSQYRGSLNQGLHNIKVRAKDTAGNVSDWSDICSITYDSIKPNLFSKTTFSGWYNFNQTSIFQYSDLNLLDTYINPTCSLSKEGINQTCTITPNICDKANNCNTAPVTSNSVNIDKTPPVSTINGGDSGQAIYSNSWNGSLSGTVSDNLSGVSEVKISIKNSSNKYFDGSEFTQNVEYLLDTNFNQLTDIWAYSSLNNLPEDKYEIKSHAIDNAGNTESTSVLTIILDKTIPETSISINPSSPDSSDNWYKTQPEITLTSSDSYLKNIQYKWDSGNWGEYTSLFKLENEGEHTLYYRATDLSGNISNVASKTIKWNKNKSESTSSSNSPTTTPTPTFFAENSVQTRTFFSENLNNSTDTDINNNNQILSNAPNNSGQILGESTTKSGRWLPILSIIAFVINFFYLKYSNKYINLIPFIISFLFFIVDWLLLKKYGCGIYWLNHYYWVGGILSYLIPVGIKNKFCQK